MRATITIKLSTHCFVCSVFSTSKSFFSLGPSFFARYSNFLSRLFSLSVNILLLICLWEIYLNIWTSSNHKIAFNNKSPINEKLEKSLRPRATLFSAFHWVSSSKRKLNWFLLWPVHVRVCVSQYQSNTILIHSQHIWQIRIASHSGGFFSSNLA